MKGTQHKPRRLLWLLLAGSVAMNLAGAAKGLRQWYHEADDNAPRSPAPVTAAPQPSAAAPPSTKGHSDSSPPSNFQWRSLESENYGAFIEGLRKIGCPESTIKDIVAGELKTASADKRAELERKILRSTDWSPPPGVSRQEYLAAQLRKLDREIDVTASDLLRSASVSGQSAPSASVAAGPPQTQDQPPPARYPAVLENVTFQPGDSKQVRYVAPGVVEAPQELLGSIQDIQENFVEEIGGPNQDVEDPQYEDVWKTAQWKADQLFRAKYGSAAFSDLTRAAAQKRYQEQRNAAAGQ